MKRSYSILQNLYYLGSVKKTSGGYYKSLKSLGPRSMSPAVKSRRPEGGGFP